MSLTLWTVRPASDYTLLQKQGFYTTDESYCDPHRLTAYGWMARQLERYAGAPPQGVTLPLWAWYRAHGRHKPKPDLRTRCFLPKGERGVRIEFAIPPAQVLLSSFDGWHAVLNNHFFTLSDGEYEAAEEREAHAPAHVLRQEKEKSWQGIFDLSLLPDESYSVQAVFWRLELAQVLRADFFTAR